MKKYLIVFVALAFVISATYLILRELGIEIPTELILAYISVWWWRLSITFIAAGLYNLCNELEDHSVRSKWKNPFRFLFKNYTLQWLNLNTSSNNKWKKDKEGKLMPYVKKWYHFGVKAKYEEAFAFSSTIRVFKTDGEHWFQFWKNIFILIGIAAFTIPGMIAWFIGKSLLQFIKEKFLKNID
jgi:hypothetical protein